MANTKPKKKEATKSQLIWLLLILLVLVLMSAGGTLIAIGAFETSSGDSSIGSISDAESVCSQRVRKNYGSQMNSCLLYTSPSPRDRG